MSYKNKQAFTLVEMIVVVTIIAILSTLAVVAYSWFASGSRDTNRLADIKNIEKLLEVKTSLSKDLPMPDDKVDITLNWKVVRYQWYAWKEVFKDLSFFDWGLDPKDETYYTYSVSSDLSKFQLMWFFEGSDVVVFNNSALKITNASLEERYPMVFWKKLWVITDSTTKEPLQTTWTGLDILTAAGNYNLYLDNDYFSTWTWIILAWLLENANCKRIKYFKNKSKDWKYNINPTWVWEISVYCDMTTDWWGWTMIANADGEGITVYNYTDIINWNSTNSNNCSLTEECISESWENIISWDSLMVYTRWYKVKWTECNDKKKSIKGYSELAFLNPITNDTWDDLTKWAHWKCDNLFEVSQSKEVSSVSTHGDWWPIHMWVQFTSNDNIDEHALLYLGPTFIPQWFWTKRWAGEGKIKNHYTTDTDYQLNLWDWASTSKQTWFIR